MKKSKIISIILALALVFAFIAACGEEAAPAPAPAPTPAPAPEPPAPPPAPGEPDPDPEPDPVTLQWAVWDIEMVAYYAPLIERYKDIAPHVTIEMVDLGATDYENILQTQLIGGADYDLIKMRGVPQYVSNTGADLLMELDDFVRDSSVDLANYMGMPEQYMGGGALYALPFRSDFWVIFYNKDLFDEVGVAYPTNEMTFDAWVETIKAVTHGSGQDKVYGNQFHWWRSTVTLFGILDGVTSVGNPNYQWMAHYYNAVIELEDGGYVPSRIDNVAGNIHHRMRWFPEEIAQVNMGTWFLTEAVEQDFNWGLAAYPVPAPQFYGNTIGGVTQLSIPRNAPNPQEAFNFIEFVVGAEGAALLASVGQFPAFITDEALSIITSIDGFPQDAQSFAALQPRNIFLEQPVVAEAGEIDAILSEFHAEIMDRSITVEAGIEAMETQVRQILGR